MMWGTRLKAVGFRYGYLIKNSISMYLKKIPIIITLLVLSILIISCKNKKKPFELKVYKFSNSQYKDFVVKDNIIWALTSDGKIRLFNIYNSDTIEFQAKNDSTILVLSEDKNADIIIGDRSNSIKRYDKKNNSWKTILKYSDSLLGITFDSKNNYYLITNKGITESVSNKTYYPDSTVNYQISLQVGWLEKPKILTDKNDNIWIGFNHGEWGGELFIFNTITKRFIKPCLDGFCITLNPINSIFEVENHVYVMCDILVCSRSTLIVQFDSFRSKPIFKCDRNKMPPHNNHEIETATDLFFGPGMYDKGSTSLYFNTGNGIYKCRADEDLSKIKNWEKVYQPKYCTVNGGKASNGFAFQMFKIESIGTDKLVFITENDGIGVFDNKTLVLFQ